jgi:membrane fusion protein, multidrug efflux system
MTGPNPTQAENNGSLLIQLLHEEQQRLRGELDRLRSEQDDLKRKLSEGNNDQKGAEDKGEGKKEDGKENDKEEKKGGGGDQGKDDKEQQEDKKKQEPKGAKAKNWLKTHPVTTIAITIGTVALLIAGYFLWQYLQSYENTDDAQVDGHTDPISARISGFVVGAYVENTYYVKKGQVLVDLDPRDYLASLERSRASLAEAIAAARAQRPNVPITTTSESTLAETARLGVESAAASLAAAEQTYQSALAELQQAEANATNARSEEERYRLLVGKLEVSKEIYDQRATAARAQTALVQSRRASADAASKSVTQAQAALEQAKRRAAEALTNLPRQIAIQSATLTSREASVQSARAQVDQALLNLQYCKIVAPVDGIVGDKSVQAGTQVSAGQEMLAITQINDIWVTANFKETQVRNMHSGQSVTIYVDALSQNFDGFVEALPGGTGAIYSLLPPENATGNYVKVVQRLPVRIRFKKGQPHEERLRPGMSVEPKVWVR